MVQVSKTFRIFVSSTFTDLKEERDALQKHVFPKLRELCMQHGCRFQAIDLRWGVGEQASLDQQTMKICQEEIARCQRTTPRPNFIVLLGDRYGWRPLPFEIPAEEFEKIEQHISEGDKKLLSKWYRCDDNAVPPVYCLQPRTEKFTDYKKWNVVEGRLRSILLKGTEMKLTEDERIKYVASATEQEIIHGLKVPDANEHVFCFFRTIKGLPQDLSVEDFIDVDEMGNLDKDAFKQLNGLKDRLRRLLPGNIYEYEAHWIGDGITTRHIDKLHKDVYNSLARIIIKELARLEGVNPLDKEIADHKAFGKDRAKFFTGRNAILQTIADYIKGANPQPLAVFGESGSGKSALMARAVEQTRNGPQNAEIIFRFIGATPRSSDGRALLESLCHQISRCYEVDESNIPTDYKDLVKEFQKRLALATGKKPLILFLDALDQLSEFNNARNLSWLPTNLPEHVRIIVSTLPGECLSVLEKKLPTANLMELKPMPLDEGSVLLDLWLKDTGRTLQEYQREEVLCKFARSKLPLYLKLAFEEACRWRSYTPKKELSPDIPGIIRDLFRRLSLDANHGKMMVSRSLGYLVTAKNGLTEDELLDVLSLDEEVFQDFMNRAHHKPPEKRLPVVVWSRLYFDLEPYLTERSADGTSLLALYHRQLGGVVAEDYLSGDAKRELSRCLTHYFRDQPLQMEKDGKKIFNIRKLSELPYNQTYGEMWDEIEHTLTDLRFVEAKCAGGLTYDLIEDYHRALDALPESREDARMELEHRKRIQKYTIDLIAFAQGKSRHLEIINSVGLWSSEKIRNDIRRIANKPTRLDRIQTFSHFVTSESHNLLKFASRPAFCIQQAYNSANSGPVASAGEELVKAEMNHVFLLRHHSHRPSFNPHPALLKTLEGHKDMVRGVCITADGVRGVSGSRDGTICVWDLKSGKCVRTLQGRAGISDVCVTPDGKLAISGDQDGTLRVWDLKSGKLIKILQGHTGTIYSVCVTPDGRRAISGSTDKTIRVWELDTGKCVETLQDHTDVVGGVSITPEGNKAVSGSWDRTVRVWDLKNGICVKTLKGHTFSVSGVCVTPDGKIAVSASYDGTLRVWDLETGKCIRILVGHKGWVSGVCVTPDGKTAISGGDDKTSRVWDLETGKCIRTLKGHVGTIFSVSVTPDGRMAVSGSRDRTLRVWDLEGGECISEIGGHKDIVSSICSSPDGEKIISAGHDGSLLVWNLETGRLARNLHHRPLWLKLAYGEELEITCVCVTPNGKRVISGGAEAGYPLVWDLETGEIVWSLGGHEWVNALCVTPDGMRAISGSSDGSVLVWDLERGKRLRPLQHRQGSDLDPFESSVSSLCVTHDGRTAISGSRDGTMVVWDLETGRCIKSLRDHTDEISKVCVTSDDNIVVSAGDKTLRVWDLNSGKCIRKLDHANAVFDACVTPDGKKALSASYDGTMKFWDLEKGNCIRILVGHTGSINGMHITADGEMVITGGSDQTLRLWDLKRGEIVALYSSGRSISSISEITADGDFAYGTEAGGVVIIKLHNFCMGLPLATPTRFWNYGHGKSSGRWKDRIEVVCPCCHQHFQVPDEILEIIRAIICNAGLSSGKSPCLGLPIEAWDDPHLVSQCPKCCKSLRFNPFIVDNREQE